MSELGFIHRWLPSASGRTLLLLHGTGGDENDLVELGRALDAGASLLSPRGKVLENGMPRFFRRLAEGVFDLEDLKLRAAELAQFVKAAEREYSINPEKLTAVGFSNGANIAAAMMLLHPGSIRNAILLRAMVPLTPDPLPDLAGTRVLMTSGRRDPIIPAANATELAAILAKAGVAVEHHWLPAGHNLDPGDLDLAGQWLRAQQVP